MKTIQLKQHGIGRYSDVSPFPLGDLEVEIVGIPAYGGDFRFVAQCNGAKCEEYTVSATQNLVKIPRDKLSAGRFSCFVSHYNKGMEVKRYPVEDLLISELNGGIIADPEIAQLRREFEALKKQGEELHKELNAERQSRAEVERAAEDAFAYMWQIIYGLLKFAYKDYRENVYLHGGNFEDFLQEFGIDLSKTLNEKIKEIKGENDDVEIN